MSPTDTAPPSVLAIVVAHDGARWLPTTLAALMSQTHERLQVVAVDNASTDGSRDVLLDALGEDRVFLADRDLGFGAAVSMVLDAASVADAPFVLFVHDDLALAPDAVDALVRAMEQDPRLAVVGPKLRTWDTPRELQSVGWTIDVTGRADSGVDVGELDQGQRDQERRSLYVSSAGMLVRRAVFDEVGRFDRRYHLFRDDLDLCWRVWLAGHDVEVEPAAVGRHAAGATNYVRLGQTRFIGPRYFAERNTLATLLKNYAAARLLVFVPLYVVVGIAKIAGFLLTRRVSDAWQTLRAWLWNLLHLRETLRLRGLAQRSRRRSDAELAPLFGKVGPRIRAYAEVMGAWISGGDADPAPEPSDRHGPTVRASRGPRSVIRALGRHPSLLAASCLLLLVTAAVWTLLVPGDLRGGEFAPWPASPMAFLSDYTAGWHEAGAFGTARPPSPAQALLGLWQVVFLGSAHAASRALLVVPLLVGFVLALRATQTTSRRRAPRVVAAVAYVLSPPAVAAVVTGRVGALVVLAVLPGIVAAGVAMGRRQVEPAAAWRAVATVTLLTAIGGAFEPTLLVAVVVVAALTGGALALVTSTTAWRLSVLARYGVAAAGPLVLLLPWSLRLFAPDGPLAGSALDGPVGGELWRWVLLAPGLAGFPGLVAGAGFLAAGVLGLVLGVRRRPVLVTWLWAAALGGALAGWWLDRSMATTWAGVPLVLTAAAYAGLLAVAFATGETQLARHAFGWRQVAALSTGVAVAASLVSVAVGLVRADLGGTYRVGEPILPSFVSSESGALGPFRVLVLTADGAVVDWDVVEAGGPTMAAYGVPREQVAYDLVGAAVDDLLRRRDPGAGGRLGALGIRYVFVPPGAGDPRLEEALAAQDGLEPRPLGAGHLLEAIGWLPRVAFVPDTTLAGLDSGGAPLDDPGIVPFVLQGGGQAVGRLGGGGAVLVTEVADGDWSLEVDGVMQDVDPGAAMVRFSEVPPGLGVVSHAGSTTRGPAVTGQILAVLLALSLAMRPPDFARRLVAADPLREDTGHGPVSADPAGVRAAPVRVGDDAVPGHDGSQVPR